MTAATLSSTNSPITDDFATVISHDLAPALGLAWTDNRTEDCWSSISFAVEQLEWSTQDLLMAEPSLFGCPWCSGDDLHELPSMLWCKCCEEPAWLDRGNGLVRADQLELATVADTGSVGATCR
jgi:hypothetical protein